MWLTYRPCCLLGVATWSREVLWPGDQLVYWLVGLLGEPWTGGMGVRFRVEVITGGCEKIIFAENLLYTLLTGQTVKSSMLASCSTLLEGILRSSRF